MHAMTAISRLIEGRPVYMVQRHASVLDAAQIMTDKNIGAVAVLEGSRLVGIFSERDVVARVIAKHRDPSQTLVEAVMTRELVVADASESDEDCLRKMKAAGCRHLPIISDDQLIGIVSLRDLLQVKLTDRDEKLEFLNDYLFHVPPGSGSGR
jgi:CBS domain-containing protein